MIVYFLAKRNLYFIFSAPPPLSKKRFRATELDHYLLGLYIRKSGRIGGPAFFQPIRAI